MLRIGATVGVGLECDTVAGREEESIAGPEDLLIEDRQTDRTIESHKREVGMTSRKEKLTSNVCVRCFKIFRHSR